MSWTGSWDPWQRCSSSRNCRVRVFWWPWRFNPWQHFLHPRTKLQECPSPRLQSVLELAYRQERMTPHHTRPSICECPALMEILSFNHLLATIRPFRCHSKVIISFLIRRFPIVIHEISSLIPRQTHLLWRKITLITRFIFVLFPLMQSYDHTCPLCLSFGMLGLLTSCWNDCRSSPLLFLSLDAKIEGHMMPLQIFSRSPHFDLPFDCSLFIYPLSWKQMNLVLNYCCYFDWLILRCFYFWILGYFQLIWPVDWLADCYAFSAFVIYPLLFNNMILN